MPKPTEFRCGIVSALHIEKRQGVIAFSGDSRTAVFSFSSLPDPKRPPTVGSHVQCRLRASSEKKHGELTAVDVRLLPQSSGEHALASTEPPSPAKLVQPSASIDNTKCFHLTPYVQHHMNALDSKGGHRPPHVVLVQPVYVDAPQTPPAVQQRSKPSENTREPYVFCKRGDFWKIVFRGVDLGAIKHLDGLSYIALLLKNPHEEIPVLDFRRMVEPDPERTSGATREDAFREGMSIVADPERKDKVIDRSSRDACRDRLLELTKQRAEAKRKGDEVLLGDIDKEVDQLTEYLADAVGKKGHVRMFSNSKDTERKRLSKLINHARAHLKGHSEALAEHLRSIHYIKGHFVYLPDTKVPWVL